MDQKKADVSSAAPGARAAMIIRIPRREDNTIKTRETITITEVTLNIARNTPDHSFSAAPSCTDRGGKAGAELVGDATTGDFISELKDTSLPYFDTIKRKIFVNTAIIMRLAKTVLAR